MPEEEVFPSAALPHTSLQADLCASVICPQRTWFKLSCNSCSFFKSLFMCLSHYSIRCFKAEIFVLFINAALDAHKKAGFEMPGLLKLGKAQLQLSMLKRDKQKKKNNTRQPSNSTSVSLPKDNKITNLKRCITHAITEAFYFP